MENRVFTGKNKLKNEEITKILTEYYRIYIENGRLLSSYTKSKEERNIYSSYIKIISNLSNLSLTKEQLKIIELIRNIKEKHHRYNKLLNMKKSVENGKEKELYDFLVALDSENNKDALIRAFESYVKNNLTEKKKKDLNRIDNLRRKANYLALEIGMFIEENDISPSSIYSKKNYIRSFDGKVMTMRCAYDFVREYVNYIDDDLIDKLNDCRRIKKKLVKQEIK